MQSRRGSLIEAAANVLIGYWVAVAAQCLIFPLFGLHASIGQNLGIGLAFTIVSLVRSYALRRMFNHFTHQHHGRQETTNATPAHADAQTQTISR